MLFKVFPTHQQHFGIILQLNVLDFSRFYLYVFLWQVWGRWTSHLACSSSTMSYLVRWFSLNCALEIYNLKLIDWMTGTVSLSQPAVASAFTKHSFIKSLKVFFQAVFPTVWNIILRLDVLDYGKNVSPAAIWEQLAVTWRPVGSPKAVCSVSEWLNMQFLAPAVSDVLQYPVHGYYLTLLTMNGWEIY